MTLCQRLVSIQVGKPRQMGGAGGLEPRDRPWRSAFVKLPVSGPVRVGRTNLDGDRQADRRVHGGPDMAVLCYSASHYPAWREELGLPSMPHGGFGENFTIEGQDEETVCIGDVYEVGEAVLQVSQPRGPCHKISYRWRNPELLRLVEESGRHGWYARVLLEGMVEAGQPLRLLERKNPQWSVRRAADVHWDRKLRPGDAAELALCQELPLRLRQRLAARAG